MSRTACATIILLLLFVRSASAAPIIHAWLEAYNSDNQPFTTIKVGQTFELRAYVEDLRAPHGGVAAAYLFAPFTSEFISPVGSVQVANFFDGFQSFGIVSGNALGGGGTSLETNPSKLPPPGPQLLFSLTMVATNPGQAGIGQASAPPSPSYDWFVFFQDEPVPRSQINFINVTKLSFDVVVPEPGAFTLAGVAISSLGLRVARRRSR
jgi:hypothetical protein